MPNEKKPPVGNVGYYHSHKYHSIEPIHRKMNGIRRVILFCFLVVIAPAVFLIVPLYIKNTRFRQIAYALIESDVLEITDGVSNVFCSSHSLRMNESFNAFQIPNRPETLLHKKHIRLKKSMLLPDDTLEYWGFYLWKGAKVALSVCSRFEGSSILVVKGEKELKTCGMLDHNKNKAIINGIYLPEANQVKIIFESNAQEINSKETMDSIRKESLSNIEMNNQSEYNYTDIENTPITNITDINNKKKFNENKIELDNNSKARRNAKNDNKAHEVEKSESRLQNKSRLRILEEELQIDKENNAREVDDNGVPIDYVRIKRTHNPQNPPVMSGKGIKHGGNNAKNLTGLDEDSSLSSFELGLLTCYNGQVLVKQEFNSSDKCLDVSYLMSGRHMQTIHDVKEDGYYYYIFYSDNDIVSNIIHAVFDIQKPTLQYENVTKACINQTECTFSLNFLSNDRVIVEVPTRDGIDHEGDDTFQLISECHPRMEIYLIFPIAIIIFVLGFAFI